MDQEHIVHAERMMQELKEMMFRLRLMKYKMHAHYHPLVGRTLDHAADLCMSAAAKLEADLEIGWPR